MRFLPLLIVFFAYSCQGDSSSEDKLVSSKLLELVHNGFKTDRHIANLLLADEFKQALDSLNNHQARPQVQSNVTLRANTQYFNARIIYQAGDFPRALKKARQAISTLTTPAYKGSPEVTIQCLHLLSELHFDHAAFSDSIGYYQRWAASLLNENTPEPILAEQQLCYALAQLYDYEYKTQMGAARLGKSLLANHPELNDVYARLLVAEGLGLKKHADQEPDSVKTTMWEEAADLMTEAKNRFQKAGSIRWREAQREKVIIVSRFQDRELFNAELLPLLLPSSSAPAAAHNPSISREFHRTESNFEASLPTLPFGFPDRLRGYFHHRNGHTDSTLYYYQKFQPNAPSFDFHLNDETYWSIIQHAIIDKQLSLADQNVRDQLILYLCLDEADRQISTSELIRRAITTTRCTYALCDFGRIRLAEYTNQGDLNALYEANAVFQFILKEWEDIFTNGEEESALNQLAEITYKIINNANETAYQLHQAAPSPTTANQLLQTMERTKAFLLLNDRYKKQDDSDFTPRIDSLKKWQSQVNMLKEREARTGILSSKERRRMQGLRKQHLDLSLTIKQERTSPKGGDQNPLPNLQALRSEISHLKGTLVFATGNDKLIGQYFDQDTTIIFTTGSLDSLHRQTNSLLNLLKAEHDSVSITSFSFLAHQLFQELIGPIRGRFLAIQELLIIPAGPLRQLPFATLLTEPLHQSTWDGLPYLLRQVSTTYSPSLRLERINAGLRPASYQDATIGTWTNPQLDLTFSRADKNLEKIGPTGSKFYSQNKCTTNTFRQGIGRYDIINLVLHAAGDPYNAYQNYLYFSPTDSLNGATISQLSTNATLVLLTACETGLGTTTVGEGTFSISRGFQQIGVPDVIYSLYKISAAASAELTQRFYYYLLNGKVPADALNIAQHDMMEGDWGPVFAFPGYWGGMIKG